MDRLDDEKYLYDLSIPGTHDSATYSTILWAKTQDRNLEEQLRDGIRFFDIRVHSQNQPTLDMKLQHGKIQLDYISFRDVLNIFKRFLEQHNREFICMSLKSDCGPEEFLGQSFINAKNEYPMLYDETHMPKVREVRGRVVLFRRFNGYEIGLNIANIHDNKHTEFDNGKFKYEVQDFYNANSGDNNKWDQVHQHLQRSCYTSDPCLHLNFTSAVDMNSLSDPIKCISNKINDQIPHFLQDTIPTWPHRYGIVLFDFYNPKIVIAILNSNFKPSSPNMLSGSVLHDSGSLNSQSGYTAVIQGDGNFVVYHESNPVWSSNTCGKGRGPYSLNMQHDGNLVVYDSSTHAIWSSNTSGKGKQPYKLIMQVDGNLVLYDSNKKPLWATSTNKK